jgi:hypothetical protein
MQPKILALNKFAWNGCIFWNSIDMMAQDALM